MKPIEIPFLELGPLFLDVLELQVSLNQVELQTEVVNGEGLLEGSDAALE